jgi:2-keto-4-pentenoate hydratase
VNQDATRADDLARLANELYDAEFERRSIAPLTDSCPDLTLEEAYEIQQINIERRIAAGDKIIGHKIGLTGRPMQEKFGVNEPDYGHLLDSMYHDEQAPLDLTELIDPQVEVEPGFVLGKDLTGHGLTIEDVIDATDHIVTCFEVIDSRITDWRIKLPDTVADNGSSSRFALGSKKVTPNGLALDDLETVLEVDGEVVESGNTSAILGHPANGIVWLGNKLAEFGIVLEAGHVVLPGTCIRCFRIAGHRQARGRIAGLGDVTLDIEGTPYSKNIGN